MKSRINLLHRSIARAAFIYSLAFCPAGEAFPKENKPSLLLITIDTLRADYLSCYGSQEVETPNLDRLARGGAHFIRARASVPLTLPSHASILTGLHPPAHGVRDNGTLRLPQSIVTLAEVLKSHGYETAAFVGAFVLDRRFGLAQGFDAYDDLTGNDVRTMEDLGAERNAEAVYRTFIGWLKEYDGTKPFFAWVHFFDPHAPYEPPEPYRSRHAANLYAGEIAYVDAVIGKIVKVLESRKRISDTVIAVVGDHGESLGEHEEQTHSILIYNSTLHVPMLIHAPGIVASQKSVGHLVRTIDLAPTVLDYLQIEPHIGQGVSLRPLIEDGELQVEVVAYSESLYPSLNLGWSALQGLEKGQYHFISAPREELYDLSEDPGEMVNQIDRLPGIAAELREQLEELQEGWEFSRAETRVILEPETEALLERLGYISSVGSQLGAECPPADPKAKMGIWNDMEYGLFLFSRGNYSGALGILNRILTTEKDIPLLYGYIGSCHMHLEQYTEAERVIRTALGRGLDTAQFHINLGLIHYKRGELGKAESELRTALVEDELNVKARCYLADVFRAAKRYHEAAEHYRLALGINPRFPPAVDGLDRILDLMGKEEERSK